MRAHARVHAYSARAMADEQRSAVASYFSVYKGHEADKVKLALGGGGAVMHPAIEAAASMLQQTWEEVRGILRQMHGLEVVRGMLRQMHVTRCVERCSSGMAR